MIILCCFSDSCPLVLHDRDTSIDEEEHDSNREKRLFNRHRRLSKAYSFPNRQPGREWGPNMQSFVSAAVRHNPPSSCNSCDNLYTTHILLSSTTLSRTTQHGTPKAVIPADSVHDSYRSRAILRKGTRMSLSSPMIYTFLVRFQTPARAQIPRTPEEPRAAAPPQTAAASPIPAGAGIRGA